MADSVQGESSSSSGTFNSTSKWEYDVFLSFAGKDTRLNFTDHLYDAFDRSGIRCFRDDVNLPRGENINHLFQAIQDSLCAVLVISENYANSTWCLDELQKILESRNTLNRWIFPIFYNVKPADVRYQRESFGKALAELEKFEENTTKVQNWRDALSEIGNLSGWVTKGKHEADLIKNIVEVVWTYLSSNLPSYYDNLVGIDSRVADMMPMLEIGLDDKRFVGIWGMGGVGKTTLARVVFKKLTEKFDICCFLADVKNALQEREGLVSLQKKLLSHLKIRNIEISDHYDGMENIRRRLCHKKVLLVIDDLDDESQLRNLAESPDWFGEGSRIIITTRYRHLLTASGVDERRIYEMKTMKNEESLQLFSKKAFNKNYREKKYLAFSKSVVKYAGGLPLALLAIGSYLCGISEEAVWRDALDKLKQINPHKNILQVLKISYDGLDEKEQTIFLDIVCFFKGWKKKEVTQILKGCDLNPIIGIKVLIEKTLLVERKDGTLDMHDLYEDLGRYIIHQECPNSRLWKFQDIKEVLENNQGSKEIEAIVLKDYHWKSDGLIEVHPEAFSKMGNIRLLILDTNCLFYLPSPLNLPKGLKLASAKSVQWRSFPLESLPLQLNELVHIKMKHSKIKQLGNGTLSMNNLEFIDLSYSRDFTETPDFSSVQSLKDLCLSYCTSLVKVHHSLGELKKLVVVDLWCCENLKILPRRLETNSLRRLDLGFCKKVTELPEFGEGMRELSYLDASYTAITTLPESLGSLTGLRELDLSGTDLVNLPTGCFSSLFELVFLSLDYCKRLESLPRLPPRLMRLEAFCCDSMRDSLDKQLWNLVASLGHECRGQTKYVFYDEEDDFPFSNNKFDCHLVFLESQNIKPECAPLRNFFAIMPLGGKIPSWFDPNIKYYGWDNYDCVIEVDVPPNFRGSKWSGIVVCLEIAGFGGSIKWSSKALEDDGYNIWWPHLTWCSQSVITSRNCIMVLEFNQETCWQHLRGDNNSLRIKLAVDWFPCGDPDDMMEIFGSGWRVICKEEIQDWCLLNHFNQPQTIFPDDEVKLPLRVLSRVLAKSALSLRSLW